MSVKENGLYTVKFSAALLAPTCYTLRAVGTSSSPVLQNSSNQMTIHKTYVFESGSGSSVGIATCYGLDGPGIDTRWGEIFRTCPHRPRGPPSLLYNGYRVFPGGKERPGCDADPSPLLVPWSRKRRGIPLFPLWAVRPVQSLSACTRAYFTFTYLKSNH